MTPQVGQEVKLAHSLDVSVAPGYLPLVLTSEQTFIFMGELPGGRWHVMAYGIPQPSALGGFRNSQFAIPVEDFEEPT